MLQAGPTYYVHKRQKTITMSRNLTPEEVVTILESGNFDDLIGVVEDEYIEAKQEPYQLEDEHNKQELAKDISGMANSKGGVILLGVRTHRHPTHFGDEITRVRPFPQDMVDADQYQDILKVWVYPSLHGVEILWFPSSADSQKGIAAIVIPKQPLDNRPFLITRTVDDTGKQTRLVFGYVERKRSTVDPMSVQRLQTLVRDGLRFNSLHQQIESVQQTLEDLRIDRSIENDTALSQRLRHLLAERIETALSEAALHQEPAFILCAVPRQSIRLPTLFQSRDAEIVRLLEKPPELRHAGFDLFTATSAEIVKGQLRRAVQPGYKILELWRDGTLIFAATGGTEFLCWGRRTQEEQPLRINQLVLLESTYLFAELSRRIFNQAEPKPRALEYGLSLRNMTAGDDPCRLISGPLGTFAWQFGHDIHLAPGPNADFMKGWDEEEIDPGVVAFRLVREVYLWFGIEYEHIPYTIKQGTGLAISPDEIKKAGKR